MNDRVNRAKLHLPVVTSLLAGPKHTVYVIRVGERMQLDFAVHWN